MLAFLAGIRRPLGPADRLVRRLPLCPIPVKVAHTAPLFVGQQRAPVRSCPVRRKPRIYEKVPADLLLGFNRAVKPKAGSLLECPNLILGVCLEGKSSSQGCSRQQEELRRREEDDKTAEGRMFIFTLDSNPEFHIPPLKQPKSCRLIHEGSC